MPADNQALDERVLRLEEQFDQVLAMVEQLTTRMDTISHLAESTAAMGFDRLGTEGAKDEPGEEGDDA